MVIIYLSCFGVNFKDISYRDMCLLSNIMEHIITVELLEGAKNIFEKVNSNVSFQDLVSTQGQEAI